MRFHCGSDMRVRTIAPHKSWNGLANIAYSDILATKGAGAPVPAGIWDGRAATPYWVQGFVPPSRTAITIPLLFAPKALLAYAVRSAMGDEESLIASCFDTRIWRKPTRYLFWAARDQAPRCWRGL